MNTEIHQLKTKPAAIKWMCSSCGVDAGCNCGAPLMSKAQLAAEAVAADPQKSNRAIASEIGVNESTVREARPSAAGHPAAETRTGLDGKQYRMPVSREVIEEENDEDGPEETGVRKRGAFLLFSSEARQLATYDGPIDEEILTSATRTMLAWCQLVEQLEEANG